MTRRAPQRREPGFAGARAGRLDRSASSDQEGRVEGSCPTPPQASIRLMAARLVRPRRVPRSPTLRSGAAPAPPVLRRPSAPPSPFPTASRWSRCSAPPTSCSGWSRPRSPPTCTCAATRSRSPASPPTTRSPCGVFDELIALLGTGQAPAAGLGAPRHRHAQERRLRAPGRRAQPRHHQPPRPHDPAQDAEPEALRRRDRRAHDRVRHRPGRHRQDLPGHGQGRAGAADQAGQPHHPDPARGRGGRAARASCPARSRRRSTPTCGRSTTRCTTWSTRSRSRG